MPTRDNLTEELFASARVRAYSAPASAALIDQLRGEERSTIAPMVATRQAEFATARACARAALAEFGIDAAIPRQGSGAPAWPAGMSGSISHTKGFCVAVAGPGSQTLGIDVELVQRMKPPIERRILVDAERAALDQLSDVERRQQVTTIFAAKEAFYKAHFAIEPRYLGFDAVTVAIEQSVVRFSVGSGAVGADLLERVQGRTRVENGRAIVGVVINTVGLEGPLP